MSGKILPVLAAAVGAGLSAIAAPEALTVEYRTNPCGLDAARPRLAWKNGVTPAHDVRQVAWRVLVASSERLLAEDRGDLWDSGRIAGGDSLGVVYAGAALKTSQRVFWKVRTWTEPGGDTGWSAPAEWTCGVMDPADWRAKWIGPAPETRPDEDMGAAQWITAAADVDGKVVLRRKFSYAPRPGAMVELVHAALPLHEVRVNGTVVNDTSGFVRRWNFLRFRDVTSALKSGENELEITIMPFAANPPAEGGPAAVAKLVLPDGETLVTDGSWSAAVGKVRTLGGIDQPAFARRLVRRTETASPAFERTFTVDKPVASAVLHVTGVGFYEAFLNGRRIGKKVLDPSFTDFDDRVLYSTYRLDGELVSGENTLRILVGHGWWDVRAVAVWDDTTAPWRDFPRAIAQLEIVFADGSRETVVTDGSWRQVASPVGYDCIREGEVIGAHDPRQPDFTAQKVFAAEVPGPKGGLEAERQPGAEIIREVSPDRIVDLGNGVYTIRFPVDVAGWARIRLDGQRRGDLVTVRYDERIGADGKPAENRVLDMHFRATASQRVCAAGAGFQTDRYVCRGEEGETYEPRFTWDGFRYLVVSGLRRPPTADSVKACVIRTAFPVIGRFECSDGTFNRLMEMAQRAYESNFVDGYPTDCPHREKNGWTGDASIASELAQYLFENTAAYAKWLTDVCDTQVASGDICSICPTAGWGYVGPNGPAWDSALPVIAWNLHCYRDDRRTLDAVYPHLVKYLAYTATKADADGLVRHGLGDWIPVTRMPSVALTSSCYYYQAQRIAALMAETKGLVDDARRFAAGAERTRAGVNARLYRGDGVYDDGGQTAQAFPIAFGIVEEGELAKVAAKLVEAVESRDGHVDMGLLGTKHVFRALSRIGRTDLAFRMLVNPTSPSPVDWIDKGGTALWEDWKDGDSRNHIMFGDFAGWAYQYLAGIRLLEAPGSSSAVTVPLACAFREFLVAPEPIAGLTRVSASVDGPYGTIVSRWRRAGGRIHYEVTVPPNTRAVLRLPGISERTVGSGTWTFAADDVR